MDLTATALPGTAAFSLSRDGFDLRATGESLQTTVKVARLPANELKVNTGPLEIALAMPIMSATMAGAYGLTLKLADIVINDAVWGLIDPEAAFPRDPADLTLVA